MMNPSLNPEKYHVHTFKENSLSVGGIDYYSLSLVIDLPETDDCSDPKMITDYLEVLTVETGWELQAWFANQNPVRRLVSVSEVTEKDQIMRLMERESVKLAVVIQVDLAVFLEGSTTSYQFWIRKLCVDGTETPGTKISDMRVMNIQLVPSWTPVTPSDVKTPTWMNKAIIPM